MSDVPSLRIDDEQLRQLDEHGWVVVPGVLTDEELGPLREALGDHYPSPEAYFADPSRHAWVQGDPFAGVIWFPFANRILNDLPMHPALVDTAEHYLGSTDIRLLRAALQAKFADAADYDQVLHYDYPNHSLVVPRQEPAYRILEGFLYLSDVTGGDGPTKLVSRGRLPATRGPVPTHMFPAGEWRQIHALEEPATGSAGSVLLYGEDVLHRGSAITGTRGTRYTLSFAYGRPQPWIGFTSWPRQAEDRLMVSFLTEATPRQRELLGFPPIGDPYWTEETLRWIAARFPGIDLEPYRQAGEGA